MAEGGQENRIFQPYRVYHYNGLKKYLVYKGNGEDEADTNFLRLCHEEMEAENVFLVTRKEVRVLQIPRNGINTWGDYGEKLLIKYKREETGLSVYLGGPRISLWHSVIATKHCPPSRCPILHLHPYMRKEALEELMGIQIQEDPVYNPPDAWYGCTKVAYPY